MDDEFDISLDVLPLRLALCGVGEDASVARLRGVWGAALRELDPAVYDSVYDGARGIGEEVRPAYWLADGGLDGSGRRLLDWTLVGADAISHHEVLRAAWRLAGGRRYGLGRKGNRRPFNIDHWRMWRPDGQLDADGAAGWNLATARWPLHGEPAATPCRVAFPSRVHLRYNNRSITEDQATWWTLVENACRRLSRWTKPDRLASMVPALLDDAENRRAIVNLKHEHSAHYSARQRKVVSYQGLGGCIDLPDGPGPAWRVLLCARWLGLGRHLTQGFGRVAILPLD